MQKLAVAVLLIIAVLGAAYLVSLNHNRSWSGEATTTPEALSQFSSEHLGLAFEYPNIYEATSTHADYNGEEFHVVTLLPKGYVPPDQGEGPPAISVQVIPNPKNLSAEQWIKTDPRSNWQLSEQNGGLGSTTVGGEPGMRYQYSGLYNTSAVVVAHNGMFYYFTGDKFDMNDRLNADFETVLTSATFI